MSIEFVEPKAVEPTLNIVLYGPAGTGKTVNACSAPGPVLVLNAEGEGALRYARGKWGDEKIREVEFTGAKVLDELYVYLKEGGGDEKTLVVDSVGEVYQKLVEEIAGGGRPSLQNYGDINTKIERFVRAVRDLPINVVLIAHEQVDDEDGEVTRRPATGGKKLPEKITAAVDVVGYCNVVPATEDTPTRYVAQLLEAKGRRAKDRSGALGASRDIDLSEWIPVAVDAMNGGQQELSSETPAASEKDGDKQPAKGGSKKGGK